jgi:hypothetical protein
LQCEDRKRRRLPFANQDVAIQHTGGAEGEITPGPKGPNKSVS